jgi:hypothetical protein
VEDAFSRPAAVSRSPANDAGLMVPDVSDVGRNLRDRFDTSLSEQVSKLSAFRSFER